MAVHMIRVTDDALHRTLKEQASRAGVTLTTFVEQLLRAAVMPRPQSQLRVTTAPKSLRRASVAGKPDISA